jgi:hypothetical protein
MYVFSVCNTFFPHCLFAVYRRMPLKYASKNTILCYSLLDMIHVILIELFTDDQTFMVFPQNCMILFALNQHFI